jgi:hypothetical protein
MSLCGLCKVTRRRKPQGSSLSTKPQGTHLTPRVFEQYQYVPLNEEAHEIRLLTLLPGTFSSEIRLCLDITPFTGHHIPEFEAVSYVWGSVESPVNIFVGKLGHETLAITKNLAEALPYFRYEDKPRVLWIDAICVDQQNLKERGYQVKRMADIYSTAAKVLVWLGPESDDSSVAIDCLEYVASKVKIDWLLHSISAITEEVHWADTTVTAHLVEAELLAICNLIHRPWFERLWIWQEVHLASGETEVICGNRKILWSALCTTVLCLFVKPTPHFSQRREYITRKTLVYDLCTGKKDLMIKNLIDQTKNCVCSDPRDKIYAVLSLLWEAESIGIEPDYTKTVYEVYQHAVLSFIESTGSLEVLTTIESHENLEGVPSWVPDVSIFMLRHINPK